MDSEDFISLKQNLMKFPKVIVFSITVMVALCSLSMFLGMRIFAIKNDDVFPIKYTLSNAVEHIEAVRFVGNDTDDVVEIRSELGRYNLYIKDIKGKPNFLLASSEGNNNIVDGTNSNILGGKQNVISKSETSTIIAGEGNKIAENNTGSVIGGGMNNIINRGASTSVIVGGANNTIGENSKNSTIVGGSNNTVVGNNSIVAGKNNTVRSNNSVALGTKSNIEGSNSFLWNDGASGNNEVLGDSNVFAIISNNGLVVNAEKAAKGVQLTVGGSLIVNESIKDNQISCGGGQGQGILKLVDKGSGGQSTQKCLCGCDGYSWNSLYGKGTCEKVCNPGNEPICSEDKVSRQMVDGKYYYDVKCEAGQVVEGSILVSSDERIHWSCQASDGEVKQCESEII